MTPGEHPGAADDEGMPGLLERGELLRCVHVVEQLRREVARGGVDAPERQLALCHTLLEHGEHGPRVRTGQRARRRDRHGLAERAQRPWRHERAVDREDDARLVRGRAQAGDHAVDGSTARDAVVDDLERQAQRVGRLPDRDHLVAGLRQEAPGPFGERLAAEAAPAPWEIRTARTRRRRAARPSGPDAPRLRVDVRRCRPRVKPQSVIAAVGGELDGERRRRADRHDDRAAGDRGLLHELEREPAADAEHGSDSGSSPSRNAQPITLSIALWRPTSSRRQRSSPSAVKRPVACSPPVDVERRLRRAQRVGQRGDHRQRAPPGRSSRAAPRRRPPRARPCRTRRTTTTCRTSGRRARGRRRAPRRRPCSRRDRPATRASTGASPSVRQKPSASSSS